MGTGGLVEWKFFDCVKDTGTAYTSADSDCSTKQHEEPKPKKGEELSLCSKHLWS